MDTVTVPETSVVPSVQVKVMTVGVEALGYQVLPGAITTFMLVVTLELTGLVCWQAVAPVELKSTVNEVLASGRTSVFAWPLAVTLTARVSALAGAGLAKPMHKIARII